MERGDTSCINILSSIFSVQGPKNRLLFDPPPRLSTTFYPFLVDLQYIKDWLNQPANNSHVRTIDIAAVATAKAVPESTDTLGDQPTPYDLHNGGKATARL